MSYDSIWSGFVLANEAFPHPPSAYGREFSVEPNEFYSALLCSIEPGGGRFETTSRKVIGLSLAQAFKSIGGLGRLITLLTVEDENINIQIFGVISLLSRSCYFECLIFPGFFQYVATALIKAKYTPKPNFFFFVGVLLGNLKGNEKISLEIMESLLLNKGLLNCADENTVTNYFKILDDYKYLARKYSIYKIFKVLMSIVNQENAECYEQCERFITDLIKDSIVSKQNDEKIFELLLHLAVSQYGPNLYSFVLVNLVERKKPISPSVCIMMPKLLSLAKSDEIMLNILRLLGLASRKDVSVSDVKTPRENRMGSSTMGSSTMGSSKMDILTDIDAELPLNALNFSVFLFLFNLVKQKPKKNKGIIEIIIRRIHRSKDTMEIMLTIRDSIKNDARLATYIFKSKGFVAFIAKIYMNYSSTIDIISLLVEVIGYSLLAGKPSYQHMMKFQKIFSVIENSSMEPLIVTALSIFLGFFEMFEAKLKDRSKIFIEAVTVFENCLRQKEEGYIRKSIEQYILTISKIADIGLKSNLIYCSFPITPRISLGLLLKDVKPMININEKDIYFKEGGFVRLITRLHLIGLSYQPSEALIGNLKLILGGGNCVGLFEELIPGRYEQVKVQFSNVRGFSHLYGFNTLEDLFYNHKTVLLYLLVELVEIMMVSYQKSPNMSFSDNPVARFLKEILVSPHLKAITAEFLVNENEIEDILAFLGSSADLPSTIFRINLKIKTILTKHREELGFNFHSSPNDFFRSLSREFSIFIENITKSSSDIDKLMLVLLEDNDYHYIKHIHLVLLVVISGRINYINRTSSRFFQSSCDYECLSDRNQTSIETLTNLYDHFQEAEEEFLISKNFRKYLEFLYSLDHTPAPESLTQIRNSFDHVGRRFLLKQKTQCKPKQFRGVERVSLADSDQLRKSIASGQSENESVSQRKLSTASNPGEYSMVKVNSLTVPAEKITIHGNHLGELTLTAKLIIFDSIGEIKITDESIIIKAPEFCRITSCVHNVYSVKTVAKVLPKTYLHTDSAIELYFKSGKSVLFNVFTKCERSNLYKLMSSWNLKPGRLIKEITRIYIQENYTRKWQSGLISNFEYILTLNSLSGRSFHDISSYPVFPWILRDYSSPTLDLNNKRIFRKLHYPIGAQTRHAREILTNKLAGWKDDDILPFHYGSHYSSAGVVTHFMLRIEPFTTEAIELQEGAFDLPERLFFSMDKAWSSGAMGLGDNKELIPELYYLPELCLFRGEEAFGCTQIGESIREVIQPHWALNPLDFTIQHAAVLESRPVKEKLRHWIDLVFGSKQQDQKNFNLFYFFTDSSNFKNALRKNPKDAELYVSQIYNFGQNPRQLFTKDHPKMLNICESKVSSVNCVQVKADRGLVCCLFTVDQTHYSISVKNHKIYVKKLSQSLKGSSSMHCVRLELSEFHRAKPNKRSNLYPYATVKPTSHSPSHFAVLANRYILSCCYPDNSFRLHSLDGKLLTVIKAHSTTVTCITAVHNYMFTGSMDSLILWWKLKTSLKLKQQYLGHTGPILALAALKSFCLLASLSTDNRVLVHELRTGELLQAITVERAKGLFTLQSGFFGAFSAHSITVFSANGYKESYSPSIAEQLQRVHSVGSSLILCGKRNIYFSEAFREPSDSLATENEIVWSGVSCTPEPTVLYSCKQAHGESSPWNSRKH